jgi:ferredoxin-NADP reductase
VPAAAAHPAAPGFRSVAVTAIDRESADVLSLTMRSPDGQPLPKALPGQYVVVRLQPAAGSPPLFRSYSLSGPQLIDRYRISVKIEPPGAAGTYFREHVQVGDALDVSAPRGSFILQSGERPVVLLSAGIGATPVLAMLYAMATARSTRQVLWLHRARDRQHHPFAAEVRRLVLALPRGRSYVSRFRGRGEEQHRSEPLRRHGRAILRGMRACAASTAMPDAYACR